MRASLVVEVLGAVVVVASAILFATQGTSAAPAGAGPHWRIVDLGLLPGGDAFPRESSTPAAIDDAGDVVGQSGAGHGDHAFLWRKGHMVDLGTLGGRDSAASAIDGGRIAGWADTSAGLRHAVVWVNGRIHDLGTGGFTESDAMSFDAAGDVVGEGYDLDKARNPTNFHALIWHNGRPKVAPDLFSRIPVLEGLSYNVSNAPAGDGTIVGTSMDGVGRSRAWSWRDGVQTPLRALPHDAECTAAAANARHWVVGDCQADGDQRAVLWRSGPPIALATGTVAKDVSDNGLVVGSEWRGTEAPAPAFVWRGGVYTRLPFLPGALTAPTIVSRDEIFAGAEYVNDHGEIAGIATTRTGRADAVVWVYR